MVFHFGEFELDTALRELRRRGERVALQPRAFEVLEFLVRHRDRVVSKEELLATLWPDVVVTDASVQRAVSLIRTATKDDGTKIRTVPKRGYRFVAPVEGDARPSPSAAGAFRPSFVLSGDVHVAYHTIGEGALDLVIVVGWVFPMRAFFDHPEIQAWIERLSAIGRVVLFDKRGTGLSDRVKVLPTLEQRVDDVRAVLDAVGSTSAILIGASEGGPLGVFYAASFPERVRGLLLCGSFARWAAAPDYPQGWSQQTVEELRQYIASAWGSGQTIRAIVPSRAADDTTAAWAARAEQEGASPGAARELLEMNLQVDVRPLLSVVSVPTIVLHDRGDPIISVENGRYLAAHIPGARLVETEAGDHIPFFEGSDTLMGTVERLATHGAEAATHFLTTVLALEADGESVGKRTLDDMAARFGGVRAGESLTWSFDGPQRAIRCGSSLQAALASRRQSARVGIHAGEVARAAGHLVGQAIETAHAIARAAPSGEVWVSQVVRDLVHGSALTFATRGDVVLADGRVVTALASGAPEILGER